MLYYYLSKDYLQGLGVVAYLIFTWIATAYAATKRKSLES